MSNSDQKKRDLELRFLQHLELKMLDIVVDICRKHGLTYYISGGTFLGAVRHKGFIPWDDDVDLALPRKDYQRLLEILEKELPDNLELVTYQSNQRYNFLRAQIWDKRLEIALTDYDPVQIQPCWIDLFPLDGAPSAGIKRGLWKIKLSFYELMWGLSRIEESSQRHQGRTKAKQLAITVGKKIHLEKHMDPKRWCRRREAALRHTPFEDSEYCLNAIGAYKFNSIFNVSEIYGEGSSFEFCGRELNGPSDFDAYLTQIYGDYMSLPPVEKRNWHGTKLVRKKKYSIGYTQGTFDMLHVGHLNLLRNAKSMCDYLIVGVNSDDLVWEYKHKHPVISAGDRKAMLESLNVVDEVIITKTLDKEEILQLIPFEAIFIGSDWEGSARWRMTGERLAEKGVELVYLPHTDGVSSTMLRPLSSDRIEG